MSPSPGLRGGCIGVYRGLRKLFNLRGLYDAQGFFALSTVVLFARISDPSEPSLVPQTAEPLAPYYFKPAQDCSAALTVALPEPPRSTSVAHTEVLRGGSGEATES